MGIVEQIQALGQRVSSLRDMELTEEGTKNALIMPLLRALGYDVFDPSEVVPEFTADIGIKKGEKVDYGIFRHGMLIMLGSLFSPTVRDLTSTAILTRSTVWIRIRF